MHWFVARRVMFFTPLNTKTSFIKAIQEVLDLILLTYPISLDEHAYPIEGKLIEKGNSTIIVPPKQAFQAEFKANLIRNAKNLD